MGIMRLGGALALSSLLLTCGCVTRLCRYDVCVKADPDLAKLNGKYPPVEVHVEVLDANDSDAMARRSMSEYWKPGRRPDVNEDQKKRMFFGEDKAFEQVFSNEDHKWAAWRRIEEPKLWVLADLPGAHQDEVADPRRVSVPLERTCWWFRRLHRMDFGLSRDGLYLKKPDAEQAQKK